MKKIILISLLLLLLTGCGISTPEHDITKDNSPSSTRFILTGESFVLNVNASNSYRLKVVKDTKTNILYLWDDNFQRGGLTPWLDEEGKPIKENK